MERPVPEVPLVRTEKMDFPEVGESEDLLDDLETTVPT